MVKVTRTKDVSLVQMKRMSQNLAEKFKYGNVRAGFFKTEHTKAAISFWVSCGHLDDLGRVLHSWEDLLDYYFQMMKKES